MKSKKKEHYDKLTLLVIANLLVYIICLLLTSKSQLFWIGTILSTLYTGAIGREMQLIREGRLKL